jgi:hypothetical protein
MSGKAKEGEASEPAAAPAAVGKRYSYRPPRLGDMFQVPIPVLEGEEQPRKKEEVKRGRKKKDKENNKDKKDEKEEEASKAGSGGVRRLLLDSLVQAPRMTHLLRAFCLS